MALNPNQLAPTTTQGFMDQSHNFSTHSCQVDTTSAGGLVAGQAVKLVNSAGGIPKVVECAADSDAVFGFINFSVKDATYAAFDYVEVSAFRGNVMYMTAGGAIARGGQVSIVIASKKVVASGTGQTVVGIALDKAAADGDLIRVYVDIDFTRATHA